MILMFPSLLCSKLLMKVLKVLWNFSGKYLALETKMKAENNYSTSELFEQAPCQYLRLRCLPTLWDCLIWPTLLRAASYRKPQQRVIWGRNWERHTTTILEIFDGHITLIFVLVTVNVCGILTADQCWILLDCTLCRCIAATSACMSCQHWSQ